eukprot:1029981-Amphidinium_carterae.1
MAYVCKHSDVKILKVVSAWVATRSSKPSFFAIIGNHHRFWLSSSVQDFVKQQNLNFSTHKWCAFCAEPVDFKYLVASQPAAVNIRCPGHSQHQTLTDLSKQQPLAQVRICLEKQAFRGLVQHVLQQVRHHHHAISNN